MLPPGTNNRKGKDSGQKKKTHQMPLARSYGGQTVCKSRQFPEDGESN